MENDNEYQYDCMCNIWPMVSCKIPRRFWPNIFLNELCRKQKIYANKISLIKINITIKVNG